MPRATGRGQLVAGAPGVSATDHLLLRGVYRQLR